MSDLFRTRALFVKPQLDPLVDQLLRQLESNDALAETQHLGIVGQDTPFDTVRIMRRHGSDPLNFVGRNGDAETGAADEEGSIGLTKRTERVLVKERGVWWKSVVVSVFLPLQI